MNDTGTQEVNKTAEKRDRAAWLKRWAASIQEAFLNRANIGLLAAGVLYGVFRPFLNSCFRAIGLSRFLPVFRAAC